VLSRNRRIDHCDPRSLGPPTVASPSGNGMLNLFKGPAMARSLGCNQGLPLRADFLIIDLGEMHARSNTFPISEQLVELSNQIAFRTTREVRYRFAPAHSSHSNPMLILQLRHRAQVAREQFKELEFGMQ